jgi:hypothetical protein
LLVCGETGIDGVAAVHPCGDRSVLLLQLQSRGERDGKGEAGERECPAKPSWAEAERGEDDEDRGNPASAE